MNCLLTLPQDLLLIYIKSLLPFYHFLLGGCEPCLTIKPYKLIKYLYTVVYPEIFKGGAWHKKTTIIIDTCIPHIYTKNTIETNIQVFLFQYDTDRGVLEPPSTPSGYATSRQYSASTFVFVFNEAILWKSLRKIVHFFHEWN
jgi:hypothetical protein